MGTPTWEAAAVRDLLRDGISKRITCRFSAKCGKMWCIVGGAMRTMEVQWTFFNVTLTCGRVSARDQKAGEGVAGKRGWHEPHVYHGGGEVKLCRVFEHAEMEWIRTGSCLGRGYDMVIQPDQVSAVTSRVPGMETGTRG